MMTTSLTLLPSSDMNVAARGKAKHEIKQEDITFFESRKLSTLSRILFQQEFRPGLTRHDQFSTPPTT